MRISCRGRWDTTGRSTPPADEAAAATLWLDAFTANIDRTWANPNLLVWHRKVWAIKRAGSVFSRKVLAEVVADVPYVWLEPAIGAAEPDAVRRAYVSQLAERLAAPAAWLPGAGS